MSRFVRASKYRHVFGTGSKSENCFQNVKPSRSAWDTNLLKANPLYVGVCWEAAGGGAFAILDQKAPGKLPAQPPLFQGHKAAVLDLDFHPFNDYVVASCSEDCKVMIWQIPQELTAPQNAPAMTLSGHSRKVGGVLFHPSADNTLASSGADLSVKIWDIQKGVEKVDLIGNTDLILSMCFNSTGTQMVTTSKDKHIRVFDVRTGKVVMDSESHQGVKGSRGVWLGDSPRIVTTGFSKTSDRQMYVWDVNNFSEAIVQENLDTSSGVIMPFYDEDCKMLYLAGKGDGNIRYYEMVDEKPWQFFLSEHKTNDPQRGIAFAPKRAANVTEIEIMKCFKLTTDKIEPISFKVPRKTDVFQEDIFPPAVGGEAFCSCDEFFGGKTGEPKRVSLANGFTAGVRKDIDFVSAPPPGMHEKKDLENPKNEKELREAWQKLKQENSDLKDKLAQRDTQIRALELKLNAAQ